MKRRQTFVCGILTAVLALAVTACPGPNQVDLATGSITGIVVFPEGEGGIAITLTLEAAVGQFSFDYVVTNETGGGVPFRFDDIPPGVHALYASWQSTPEGEPVRDFVRNVDVRAGIVYPLGNIIINLGCACTSGTGNCGIGAGDGCDCGTLGEFCDCTQPVAAITIVSNGVGVTALGLAPRRYRVLYARCPGGNAISNVLWFSTNPDVISVQRPAGRSMVESGASVQITVATGAVSGQTATIRATSMGGVGGNLVEAALVVTVADAYAPGSFVRVDGGTFLMGGDDCCCERPIRNVTVSGFYMSRFLVTQGEWYDVMGTWPSHFTGTNAFDHDMNEITVTPAFDRRNLPVEQVLWYNALVFSNRLSIKRGLTPAYIINDSINPDDWGPLPSWPRDPELDAIWNAVEIIPDSTGYRLPTEAQWEFAARGGIVCQGNFAFSGSNTAADVAWHSGNSGGRTHEVGTRQPNALGLYDMSGNVWEWVWDRWGRYPDFGASGDDGRAVRGGSWYYPYYRGRLAHRVSDHPANGRNTQGFRLVRP